VYLFPGERHPSEHGLAPLSLVYTLTDVYHVPRRVALCLSWHDAHVLLARCAKDRVIDAAIRKAAHYV
jgi:hypothetical protein